MDLARDDVMRLDLDYGPGGEISVTFTQAADFDASRMFDGIPRGVVARAQEMRWTPLERKVFDAIRTWPKEERRAAEDFLLLRRCHKVQAQDRSSQGREGWLAQRLGRANAAEPVLLHDPDDLRPRVQAQPRQSHGHDRGRGRAQ